MERSIVQGYAWLILWMEADFGWNRWKAYDLLTHVGQISIGYYGIGTVAAKIDRRNLGSGGVGSRPPAHACRAMGSLKLYFWGRVELAGHRPGTKYS